MKLTDRFPRVAPALTLVAWWAALAILLVAVRAALGAEPPRFPPTEPFVLAGLLAARTADTGTRRTRLVSAAVLVLASASTWTLACTWAGALSPEEAATWWAAAVAAGPLTGAAAYFGMWIGAPLEPARLP